MSKPALAIHWTVVLFQLSWWFMRITVDNFTILSCCIYVFVNRSEWGCQPFEDSAARTRLEWVTGDQCGRGAWQSSRGHSHRHRQSQPWWASCSLRKASCKFTGVLQLGFPSFVVLVINPSFTKLFVDIRRVSRFPVCFWCQVLRWLCCLCR